VVNWKLIRRQGSRNTRNGQRYLSYMSIKSLLEDVIFWWLCIRMESWRRCSKRRRCWFLLTEKVQSRETSCISVQTRARKLYSIVVHSFVQTFHCMFQAFSKFELKISNSLKAWAYLCTFAASRCSIKSTMVSSTSSKKITLCLPCAHTSILTSHLHP
jgi:hypothetical protein